MRRLVGASVVGAQAGGVDIGGSERHPVCADASGQVLGAGGVHPVAAEDILLWLRPKYSKSKDNLLADLLSRLKQEEFNMRSAANDAHKQHFDGLNAWANLPFSVMYDIFVNFLRCKRWRQMRTGGRFLVPVREGDEAYDLVSELREVFRPSCMTGCDLCVEELLEELAVAVEGYQGRQYTETTQRLHDTGVKTFLTFCVRFTCLGCLESLLPATDATLACFIASLLSVVRVAWGH
ncbi:hypothetical protein CYMTET_52807 [Cymbomonas tetramitiformis]|uniref:Uncharacterized protein n=1 Tax=Cymbomonas tetramitiformis TaxID=36881 RepID=A0AAE0EQF7_9CHLO|nr:hypothetical protein CYMTET_52807 [Cymbomonas tetramitiformis]